MCLTGSVHVGFAGSIDRVQRTTLTPPPDLYPSISQTWTAETLRHRHPAGTPGQTGGRHVSSESAPANQPSSVFLRRRPTMDMRRTGAVPVSCLKGLGQSINIRFASGFLELLGTADLQDHPSTLRTMPHGDRFSSVVTVNIPQGPSPLDSPFAETHISFHHQGSGRRSLSDLFGFVPSVSAASRSPALPCSPAVHPVQAPCPSLHAMCYA